MDLNTRTRNMLLASQRWRAMRRIMLSPSKISDLTATTLVLVLFEHKMIT